jgi:Amt family ammonium transporter
MSSIWIGLAAGVICAFAVHLKFKAGYDDALDVVGVHFVGGLVGSLMIGLFADSAYFGNEHMDGLFYGGGLELLLEQAIANGVTIVYSAIVTALILLALKATIGIRVPEEAELSGLDISEHAETAYNIGEVTMGRA